MTTSDEYAEGREALAQQMRAKGHSHESILDALDVYDDEHPIPMSYDVTLRCTFDDADDKVDAVRMMIDWLAGGGAVEATYEVCEASDFPSEQPSRVKASEVPPRTQPIVQAQLPDMVVHVVDAQSADGEPYHGPAAMPRWMAQALGYES